MDNNYFDFLKSKRIFAPESGFDINPEDLNPAAFEWQKSVVKWSLKRGKAALFEDCGLGKTLQELMFAEQVSKFTKSPTLIIAPLAVAAQTKREAEKFGICCNIAETAADIAKGVNITNYEKSDKFNSSVFSGIVLDESSILKAYMGKTKRMITERFKSTPYKLAATATPAPNDLMELLNHAEFLDVMKSSEALAVWFIADQSRSGKYRLKGHAEADFWKWVASWAVCIETPADIGFDGDGYILPPKHEIDIIIESDEMSDDIARDGFFRNIDMSATGYHREKRRTLKKRCEKTAEIVNSSPEQFAVWCDLNDEADELKKLIPDSVEIRGCDSAWKKERAGIDFADGKIRVLISKPSIFGYGLNFQNCHNTVFCGMDYSFENYYQAIRRFWRFGQKKEVNIYRIIGSAELNILNTVNRKAEGKEQMRRSMAKAMKNTQSENLREHFFRLDLTPRIFAVPDWLRSVI